MSTTTIIILSVIYILGFSLCARAMYLNRESLFDMSGYGSLVNIVHPKIRNHFNLALGIVYFVYCLFWPLLIVWIIYEVIKSIVTTSKDKTPNIEMNDKI